MTIAMSPYLVNIHVLTGYQVEQMGKGQPSPEFRVGHGICQSETCKQVGTEGC